MHLISATADLVIAGRPRPGFPILLWEAMSSCLEVNDFFRYYLLRGAIGSQRSWPSTGRALYDFFSFLEAHDLKWTDVDRGEDKTLIAAYRDYCFDTVKLKRNTVRQRILYICEFYKFAFRKGWIAALPFEYEDRSVYRGGGFLTHTNASGGKQSVNSVMPKKHRDLPKFLSKEQVKALVAASANSHHRMIIRTALQTGLRREELASFPVSYIVNPKSLSSNTRNVRIVLDPDDGSGMKTKGSKMREIVISRRLMQDLHHYVVHQRGIRATLSSEPQPALFLTQSGQPWSADGKGIEKMVSRIGLTVGIKTHPHMLRHTYATHTLAALQRQSATNRVEPLAFLQLQLGHASISTTMIYLHLVNERADDAVLQYDDELNDWLEEQR